MHEILMIWSDWLVVQENMSTTMLIEWPACSSQIYRMGLFVARGLHSDYLANGILCWLGYFQLIERSFSSGDG